MKGATTPLPSSDPQEILAQVERAKKEWEVTADALPQLVCLLDHQKRILRANRTVERWQLAPVVEVKGQQIHDLLHPGCDDPACYLDAFVDRAWAELARERSAESEAQDEILRRYLHIQVRPILPQDDKEQTTATPFAAVVIHDVTERKRMEEQLRAALREKEVLLQEVHHRVKNNFQVVSSMLDFQVDYVHDPQIRDALRDSQRRIHSMALIHEQLYHAPDLAQIDLVNYLQSLTSGLFSAYRANLTIPVVLELDVRDVLLEIKQAIPCGLIINELVSNALKHAFSPEQEWPPDFVGEIHVTLCPADDGKYALSVSDNGVGLPPDFEFPSRDTLGMFLVETFARQLKGSVCWDDDAKAGATCHVLFEV